MIYLSTIAAAQREMGLPDDEETILRIDEEIDDAFNMRFDEHVSHLENAWFDAHPEADRRMPGEVTEELWERARLRTEEEILEEMINEPVRAYYAEQERARQEAAGEVDEYSHDL